MCSKMSYFFGSYCWSLITYYEQELEMSLFQDSLSGQCNIILIISTKSLVCTTLKSASACLILTHFFNFICIINCTPGVICSWLCNPNAEKPLKAVVCTSIKITAVWACQAKIDKFDMMMRPVVFVSSQSSKICDMTEASVFKTKQTILYNIWWLISEWCNQTQPRCVMSTVKQDMHFVVVCLYVPPRYSSFPWFFIHLKQVLDHYYFQTWFIFMSRPFACCVFSSCY